MPNVACRTAPAQQTSTVGSSYNFFGQGSSVPWRATGTVVSLANRPAGQAAFCITFSGRGTATNIAAHPRVYGHSSY